MVSVRWVAPVLLLAVAIPMSGATKKSSSRPPTELHRVGDHWTAYNAPDPSTYAPGAKTYTIKAGDTLWALAQQFFKNAYLWPQLWESNTWITDAHWIYPGDVLLIEGEAVKAAAAASASSSELNPPALAIAPSSTEATGPAVPSGPARAAGGGEELVTNAAEAVGGSATPIPLGGEHDVYCFGYVGDPREPMPNVIQAFEDVEMRYQPGAVVQSMHGSVGDLILIDGGTATGLVAGETYLIVDPAEIINHPAKRGVIVGRQYIFRGQVRILCADDHHARGIISQSCSEVRIGSCLKPLPQIPIPVARIPDMPAFCDDSSGKRNGYIVNAEGNFDWTIGEGVLVEVNLGRDDQIQPGDFLTIYRDTPQPGQRRQVLGEIGVLTTEGHTATGKVVAMRYAIKIGDRVEVR